MNNVSIYPDSRKKRGAGEEEKADRWARGAVIWTSIGVEDEGKCHLLIYVDFLSTISLQRLFYIDLAHPQ